MKITSYGKRAVAVLMAFVIAATAGITMAPSAEAVMFPTSNGQIKGYVLSASGNTQVYTNSACTTKQNEYISAGDECYITKYHPSYNSFYVSYPTKSGRKSRWVPASAFTSMSAVMTGTPVTMVAQSKITTYKKNNTNATYGSISKGDKVYILETSGSMTRVVYPVSGGCKIAWALNTQLFPFSNGNYKIHSVINSEYCVDIFGASNQLEANAQIYRNNTESHAQNFAITHVKDGWYKIQNMGSGMVLDVAGGSSASGTNIWQYSWNGTDAQLWQIIWNGNSYYLRNKLGCYMDVYGANAANGTNLNVYAFNATNAQCFTFSAAQPINNPSSPSVPQTEESKILARLDAMMSGSYGNNVYKIGTRYTGPFYNEQCKGFAKQIHKSLFGYNIGSTKGKPNNHQIGITGNTVTVGSLGSTNATSVKNLLSQGRPGDFIQVRRSHSGSHSMIFLSANNSSVTVYECNVDNKNGIVKNTYDWNKFASDNSKVSLYTAKNYWLH